MDADDVWLPHALASLLSAAQANTDCIGSHGLADFIDTTGAVKDEGVYARTGRTRLGLRQKRLEVRRADEPTDFDVLINGNVLFPPGLLLVQRASYERVGPFDESFNGPEDWDMLIRLSRLGPIAFLDEVVLHYRRHSANLGAAEGVAAQAWRVRCKAFYSPENTAEQQRSARAGWRAYQRRLFRESGRTLSTSILSIEGRSALLAAVRLPVILVRFARGRPLPRVPSAPDKWDR